MPPSSTQPCHPLPCNQGLSITTHKCARRAFPRSVMAVTSHHVSHSTVKGSGSSVSCYSVSTFKLLTPLRYAYTHHADSCEAGGRNASVQADRACAQCLLLSVASTARAPQVCPSSIFWSSWNAERAAYDVAPWAGLRSWGRMGLAKHRPRREGCMQVSTRWSYVQAQM